MKTRNRVLIFLIVFVILTSILAYASSVQLSPSDAQSLSQGVKGIKGTVLGIFQNNVQIALIEFIPGIGPAMGVYSSYDTGLAIAALAETSPTAGVSGPLLLLILLFTPIFWIEFTCYSLAVEESIALVVSFRNHDFRSSEWKWLVATVIFVVATLFVSARLEVNMISSL